VNVVEVDGVHVHTQTRAPDFVRRSEIALPMPLAPPVTTAVFPERSYEAGTEDPDSLGERASIRRKEFGCTGIETRPRLASRRERALLPLSDRPIRRSRRPLEEC